MKNQLEFFLKLLLFSALLSLFIKYAEPLWIPATMTNALIMVLSPTVIMLTALLWRLPKQKQN